MGKYIGFFIICLQILGRIAIGQVVKNDTMRTHPIEEVSIPGTKSNSDIDQLAYKYAPDLSKALAQMPEIYLRQYGPTGASSISLNGLGASQTSLEWNGVPINSALLGQADANQFTSGGARILKSGASAFSSNQAAALNMATQQPDSGISASLGQMVGSYGLSSTVGNLGFRHRNLAILGRYQWNESRNNYLVSDPTRGNEVVPLPNARAFRKQAEVHAWHSGKILSTEGHFFSSLWGRHLAPSVQSLEKQTNESLYGHNNALILSEIFDKRHDSARVQYSIFSESYQYGFPSQQLAPQRFAFLRNQLKASYFRKWLVYKAGFNYEMIQEGTSTLERVGKKQRFIHYFLPTVKARGQQAILGVILFRDAFHLTPQLNLHTHGFNLLIRQTFRPPTLNDLYYPVYGNLNVKPEQAIHLEAGYNKYVSINTNSNLNITSNLGHYRFSNYIQWIPNSNIYQPTNLANISNLYLNTNLVFTQIINKSLLTIINGLGFTKIGFASSYFSLPEKQLIYTPRFQNSSSIALRHGAYSASLNGKYIAKRYSTSTNTDTKPLPAFFLVNARAEYTKYFSHITLTGFAAFGNLLGVEYEWVQSFPMPRYELTIGLQIETNI